PSGPRAASPARRDSSRGRRRRRTGSRRHRMHLGTQPAALLQTRQSVRDHVRRRQLPPRRDRTEGRGWGRGLKDFVELHSRVSAFEYGPLIYGLTANDIFVGGNNVATFKLCGKRRRGLINFTQISQGANYDEKSIDYLWSVMRLDPRRRDRQCAKR